MQHIDEQEVIHFGNTYNFDIIVYNLLNRKEGKETELETVWRHLLPITSFQSYLSNPCRYPFLPLSPTKAVFSFHPVSFHPWLNTYCPPPCDSKDFYEPLNFSLPLFLQMAAVATLQVPKTHTLAFCPKLLLVNLLHHNLITAKDRPSRTLKYD